MKEDFKNILKQVIEQITGGANGQDVAGDAIRGAAAQAKVALDDKLMKFSPDAITKMTSDVYGLVNGQQLVDALATAGYVGEEKIKGVVEGLVSGLKNRSTALGVAKGLKEILNQVSVDDLDMQIRGMLSQTKASMEVQLTVQILLMQAKPVLEGMKYDSEEVIADKVMLLADTISGDLVAQLVGSLTADVAARITAQTDKLTSNLPAPETVAGIIYGVGAVVSQNLDRIANSNTPEDAVKILRELGDNVKDMVTAVRTTDFNAKAAPKATAKPAPVKKVAPKKVAAPKGKKKGGKKFEF